MFRLSSIFFTLFTLSIYPAVITTVVLYLYPLFFGCEFPPAHSPKPYCYLGSNTSSARAEASKSTLAPFRLLAFGDPQLEGDTSLPDYTAGPIFPSLSHLRNINTKAVWRYNRSLLEAFYHQFTKKDLPILLWSYRKRLDLWGNDYYLAHQYRTLQWWLKPTHVAVLGDLLGSQWISDKEFSSRSERFWQRVFRHGTQVPETITTGHGWREELNADMDGWNRRIINVPGNHDVGYAGDLSEERMSRYEKAFGGTNWDVTFNLPSDPPVIHSDRGAPSIRLVTLNSMNLDSPALSPILQTQTYDYLNNLIARSNAPSGHNVLTLFLTHIPLPKPTSTCVDDEFFRYYTDEDTGGSGGGALREQNHLSRAAAKPIIEGVFGLSANPLQGSASGQRKGLILTGHDHEGCDIYHFANLSAPRDGSEWSAVPFNTPVAKTLRENADVPGVREVTLRSMMGEFGGRAGLVSAWWDEEEGWRVEVGKCDAGVQHFWWGVHVLDLVAVLFGIFGVLFWCAEQIQLYHLKKKREKERVRRRRLERRRRSKSRSKSKSVSATSTPAGTVKVGNGGYFDTPSTRGRIAGDDSVRKRRTKREREVYV